MPRVSDGGGGARFRIPGVYERLLLKDCEQVYEPNPCLVLVDDWRKANDEYEQAKAEGLRQAGVLFKERIKAGEPISVAGSSRSAVLAGCSIVTITDLLR